MPSAYRCTDDATRAQAVSIRFERMETDDSDADLSYLEQDYADVADEAERAKYVAQDRERIEAYNRGDWHMRGLYVRAHIAVPIGGHSFANFHLDSPGLWGVESDCGEDYEKETWDNEEHQLRQMLATMAPELAKLAAQPIPAPRVRTVASELATRTVASELATRLVARENCRDSRNMEWLGRHERTIEAIAKQFLPSGSGFDSGTTVDMEASSDTRLVFVTSYHHMDQNGMYDGWTEHKVTARATFNGWDISVSGRDRDYIKDHIAEVFSGALAAEVSDQFLVDVK